MLVEKIKAKINASLSETKRNVSLAERMAGVPENTIRNILEGTSKNPKIETLQAIAKFLDCSLDELVGNIPKQHTKPQTNVPLNSKLSGMPSLRKVLDSDNQEILRFLPESNAPLSKFKATSSTKMLSQSSNTKTQLASEYLYNV